MKLHAAAQSKVHGLVVDQLPFGRQQRLDLERCWIAIDEIIPRLMSHHDAGAQVVVIGIYVRHRVPHGDAQGIGRFLSRGGRRRLAGQNECKSNSE